jgi:hypothetical protein
LEQMGQKEGLGQMEGLEQQCSLLYSITSSHQVGENPV